MLDMLYSLHTKCISKAQKITSASRQVRDDQFILGSLSNHGPIARHLLCVRNRGVSFGDRSNIRRCWNVTSRSVTLVGRSNKCHFLWREQHVVMLEC